MWNPRTRWECYMGDGQTQHLATISVIQPNTARSSVPCSLQREKKPKSQWEPRQPNFRCLKSGNLLETKYWGQPGAVSPHIPLLRTEYISPTNMFLPKTKKIRPFDHHEYRNENIFNFMYDIRSEKDWILGTAKYSISLQSSVSDLICVHSVSSTRHKNRNCLDSES